MRIYVGFLRVKKLERFATSLLKIGEMEMYRGSLKSIEMK